MSSEENGDGEVRHTTDHTLVRSVIEERGGYPAHEPMSEGEGDQGLLQIGERTSDDDLKEISWEEFFEEFEQKDLEYVYPEDPSDADSDDEALGQLKTRSGK